jgi:hypothetical protein
VLIPAQLVETGTTGAGDPAAGRAGRHEQLPAAPARLVREAGPRPSAPAPPWESAVAPPPGPRPGHAPLPRRERLANLAPELRTDAPAVAEHPAPRRPQRGPDEARGAMSAFQRGSRLGRESTNEDKR